MTELFILATDSKLNNIFSYIITDEKLDFDGIHVKFDFGNHLIKIHETYQKEGKIISIRNEQVEFFHLIKIATSLDYEIDTQESVIDLLELIKHPLPKQHVRITVDY